MVRVKSSQSSQSNQSTKINQSHEIMEQSAMATKLKQTRKTRKSAVLNRYSNLLFDLNIIPDNGLEELIKYAKIELEKRHRFLRQRK